MSLGRSGIDLVFRNLDHDLAARCLRRLEGRKRFCKTVDQLRSPRELWKLLGAVGWQ